jgi:hypothetical protein
MRLGVKRPAQQSADVARAAGQDDLHRGRSYRFGRDSNFKLETSDCKL